MRETIKNFSKQFEYEPVIVNAAKLRKFKKFIVVGMGGSHLAADLLKTWNPRLEIIVHQDYGLPTVPNDVLKNSLIILSSYSGNTEEVIDAWAKAKEKKLSVAAVAVGGRLLELAKLKKIPYIQIPDTGIQPRSALGFSFQALLKLMGETKASAEAAQLAKVLNPTDYETVGKNLAKRLKGFVPIIYSSARHAAVANNWKIKFNETGKIPAFYNVFSELNHNEMTGFDAAATTRNLTERFYFLILRDAADQPRIIKRMEVLQRLFLKRGLPVEVIELIGQNSLQKIFSSLILADWAAFYTAEQYGVESEQVPMVEEFKQLIR